jgi:hypothetical protein
MTGVRRAVAAGARRLGAAAIEERSFVAKDAPQDDGQWRVWVAVRSAAGPDDEGERGGYKYAAETQFARYKSEGEGNSPA